MIADDRAFEREKLRSIVDWAFLGLELAGEARNGREALELCHSLHPDIVICDIRMPVMDGIRLARTLLDEYPNTRIIFMSAYSDFAYAQQAIELNICGYLLKSYTEQDITEILRKTANTVIEDQDRRRKEDRLAALYQQNLDTLRSSFILEIMNAETAIDEKTFWSKVNALGLDLQYDLFAMLRITLDDCSSAASDKPLARSALTEAIRTIVSRYCRIYYLLTEQNRACDILLNIDETLSRGDAQAMVETIAQAVHEEVSRLSGPGRLPNISVSSFGYGFQSWPRLYHEVLGEMPRSDQNLDPSEAVYREYKQIEPELLDSIRQQQLPYALQFIRTLTEKARQMNQTAAGLAKTCLCFCQEVQKLADDDSPTARLFRADIAAQAGQILNLQTVDDVWQWFRQVLEQADHYLRLGKKNRNEQIIQTVLKIIECRYSGDIDVASISREVFLSQNYLRQIFKECMGKSLSAYLTDYRLNKACELLKSTNVRVADIPRMVGLANNPHFFYLFKRATNLTPTEYRQYKGVIPAWRSEDSEHE